jgi:hypothetical protein
MEILDRIDRILNERKFDLGSGHKGNGITVWNRAKEVHGDYEMIAHIDRKRKITWNIKNPPKHVKDYVEKIAKGKNPRATASQSHKVFDEGKRQSSSTKMECMECGHKFKKKIGPRTLEVRCPKCKGYDTDLAYESSGWGKPKGKMAGWIAIYNGKKLEIKKSEAKDLYGAKQLAIKHFKVPKSKQGLLAIDVAYE